jgi:hypothetical protein
VNCLECSLLNSASSLIIRLTAKLPLRALLIDAILILFAHSIVSTADIYGIYSHNNNKNLICKRFPSISYCKHGSYTTDAPISLHQVAAFVVCFVC